MTIGPVTAVPAVGDGDIVEVAREVTADEVVKTKSLETVNGASLPVRVEEGTVRVGEAKVVQPDVRATNGVIHVIDRVLIPSTDDQ